jgi:long-subunit fatty acid transport protein
MCKQLLIIYVVFVNPMQAFANIQFEIPSSFHPTGYGARSKGMGSAFTGLCDDATAVSHNPAGLIQLRRPEFSFVYRYEHRDETIAFNDNSHTHPAHDKDLDYLSVTYPFRFNDMDMGFTVAYQHLFDFNRHRHFNLKENLGPFEKNTQVSYDQTGRLTALGFSYCIGLTPKLSFGVTLNVWDDAFTDNQWQQSYRYDINVLLQGNPYDEEIILKREQYEITGLNANLGLLWEFYPDLRMGIVLKTPFHADLDYQNSIRTFDTQMNPIDTPILENYDNATLSMPLSFGIGLSYRMSEAMLFTADIYHTLWDDFWIQDQNDQKISPILGQDLDESHIQSTTQVRMGMEYLFVEKQAGYAIPFRMGGYYDPVPWEFDSQDYWGVTVGSGVQLLTYQQLTLDVAYEYRWGEKPVIKHPMVFHYSEKDTSQQVFVALTVYLE